MGEWIATSGHTSGLLVFDGGTSTFAELSPSGGVQFNTTTTSYGPTNAAVAGTLNVTGNTTVSGAIFANGGINAVGSTIGGVQLLGNNITTAGYATAAYFSASVAQGFSMPNTSAGGNTALGTGGGAVNGVNAQAFYVYTPNIAVEQLAVDDYGNLGIANSLYAAAVNATTVSTSATVLSATTTLEVSGATTVSGIGCASLCIFDQGGAGVSLDGVNGNQMGVGGNVHAPAFITPSMHRTPRETSSHTALMPSNFCKVWNLSSIAGRTAN